jgi:hypothetical protein
MPTRPEIITGRQLYEMSAEALAALYENNSPPRLYNRSGEIARIRVDERGQPKIEQVTDVILRHHLSEVADFYRPTLSGYLPTTPPLAVAKDILVTEDLRFPPLKAITEIPVMRADGSILDVAGYDSATRLSYHPCAGFHALRVPTRPSQDEVAQAVELIFDAIGEFPYTDTASRANAFATLLTPFTRPTLNGASPLALINAPLQGTGKILLAEVAAYVATGRSGSMMAAPDSDEEWRKRLTAALYSGACFIVIDNIEGRLEAPSLASAISSHVWRDRILGRTETIDIPQRATWLATVNNIRLGGDLQRRCYWVGLDAGMDRPWLGRKYRHPDLRAWVAENRAQLVAALLTLIRAWHVAGKPPGTAPVLGGFETWCRTRGGILAHAEVEGFLGNLQSVYEIADEETAEWEQFLIALAAHFPSPFTAASVVECLGEDQLVDVLPEALESDRQNPQGSFSKRLGKAFSKRLDRRYGPSQARLVRAGEDRDGQLWRVVRTPPS